MRGSVDLKPSDGAHALVGFPRPQPTARRGMRPRFNIGGEALCKLFIGFASLVVVHSLAGCRSVPETPYEYQVMDSDRLSVEDPNVKTDEIPKLKVAIRSAKKIDGLKNVGDAVCAKVKGKIATSDFFEIAVRDDLASIEVENELSGNGETDVSVTPSELLLLVDASITSYLGGTKPGEIAKWQKVRADAVAKGNTEAVLFCDNKLKGMQQAPVESEEDAFGVAISATCSAYDCATKRQYVSYTASKNFYGSVRGRLDAVIDKASTTIAADFLQKLNKKIAPAMNLDSLVIETRGSGAVAKVDTTAIRRRLFENERVVFYTHVKTKNGVMRREIASGVVCAVEDGAAWVNVSGERGYGKVKIGHCADFPKIP